ncbi:MAG: type II toxin-antitoxin system VapC family toxin [Saprospiraceae bacterium]
MDYLWDTNILLHFLNKSAAAKQIQKRYNLLNADNQQFISVVSIGEIKSLAKRRNWKKDKLNRLFKVLETFIIADINVEEIIERYAEIDAFSQKKMINKSVNYSTRKMRKDIRTNMGKNDIWIAATASVLQITLITADKDFKHLNKVFLDLKFINLKSLE